MPKQIRIAFDGDAVLFSKESEMIYQQQGLEAFIEHEKMNAEKPLPEGPFAKLLKTLSFLQFDLDSNSAQSNPPIRTALVTARNTADGLIHATRKSMEEMGEDKLEAIEKEAIEAAIKDLEEVMKGEDKDAIEAKTKALSEASAKMAERLYAQQGGAEAAAGAAGEGAAEGAAADSSSADDDVVDAEFEEVKDDK